MTVLEDFRRNAGMYQQLRDVVLFTLNSMIAPTKIKTHSIIGRVKDEKSFRGKIERKGYTDPFEQTEDIVGCRVVCLFVADLPELDRLVRQAFDVLNDDDKIRTSSVDAFGYMSVHYICRLRSDLVGPHYEGIKHIKFEIQCRTLLMDAWANVSHYLAYKGDNSIPDHLKRDFHALSGLFYVADRHFELFYGESENATEKAREKIEVPGDASDDQRPVNLANMIAYLAKKYPDRYEDPPEAVSEYIEEVALAGYNQIRAIDKQLNMASVAMLKYEEELPPTYIEPWEDDDQRFSRIGAARIGLAIADPKYANVIDYGESNYAKYRKHLTE